MLETIFVGFMIVIASGAGILAWWMENGLDNTDDKRRDI